MTIAECHKLFNESMSKLPKDIDKEFYDKVCAEWIKMNLNDKIKDIMTSDYVKHLIEVNKFANAEINQLEAFIKVVSVNNDKEKANFGNACVMLRSLRAVADTTEAMLINENVLQDDNGGLL